MKTKATACVIRILVGEDILLLKRAPSCYVQGWCLPGGKLEPKEKSKEGVLRELLEETGIRLVSAKYIGVYSSESTIKPHVVCVYEAKMNEKPSVILSHEHSAYMWIPKSTIANRILSGLQLSGNTNLATFL
jgi:ADP-ribose pyrophosphatase YjhB (NUDIX family)